VESPSTARGFQEHMLLLAILNPIKKFLSAAQKKTVCVKPTSF